MNWLPTLSKKSLALLPALLLVASACGGTTTSGTTFKGTKKVGLSTSLTGSVASYGQAGLNGIQMAIDEVNARGGVNGYKIELDQADDAAKAALGTENARRLIVECDCENGCPSCVGPAGNTGPLAKVAALRILALLLDGAGMELAAPE